MFGFINKVIGGHGVGFDHSLERFPQINVRTAARRLRLAKKGTEDGAKNIPDRTQTTLTYAEREAIQEVNRLRNDAINNFDIEISTYQSRIADARSDSSDIELQIANAVVNLQLHEDRERNYLEILRDRVEGMQDKIEAFKKKHRIIGPPRDKHPIWLTVPLIGIVFAIESALNGFFFAERHEFGQIGGITLAALISAINIFCGLSAGSFTLYINRKGFFNKISGIFSISIGLVAALAFNFMIAHFRDVLGGNDWDSALYLAISKLWDNPIGLESVISVIVLLMGFAVAFLAFLKGLVQGDPVPGYNRLWNDYERANEEYAHRYEAASKMLDEGFQEQKRLLKEEVEERREYLRSAVDAYRSKSSIKNNFSLLVDETENAANQLLRVYREANIGSRSEPAPAYFDSDYIYDRSDISPPDVSDFDTSFVDAEISKMENLMKEGVEKLTAAQIRSLRAFLTIEEIRDRDADSKARELNTVLDDLADGLGPPADHSSRRATDKSQRAKSASEISKLVKQERSRRGKDSSTEDAAVAEDKMKRQSGKSSKGSKATRNSPKKRGRPRKTDTQPASQGDKLFDQDQRGR